MHKETEYFTAAWRNGIASDYESGDCRFDPCGGHCILFFFPLLLSQQLSRRVASNASNQQAPIQLHCSTVRAETSLLAILFRPQAQVMRFSQIHRFPERLLSTVQRGTAFEYRALALLTKHMSMSLTRVGGSYDGGVDLIGWWWVPSSKKNNPTTTRACRVLA